MRYIFRISLFYFLARVTLKGPCQRKFAEFVSYHVFGDKNLIEDFAVVHHKGKADEFGNYGASSRPGLYWVTRAGIYLFSDLVQQLLIYIWAFFKGSSHYHISYLAARLSPYLPP